MIAQKSRKRSMTGMLKRTSEHISACLGKPISAIQVSQLIMVGHALKDLPGGQGLQPDYRQELFERPSSLCRERRGSWLGREALRIFREAGERCSRAGPRAWEGCG